MTALFDLLGPVLGKLLAQKGAVLALDGVLSAIRQEGRAQGLRLEAEELAKLRKLLADDSNVLAAVAAQFKTTARRGGVILAGPSGAGKTALFHYLTNEHRIAPLSATTESTHKSRRFGARIVRVRDTPGSSQHSNLKESLYDYIEKGAGSIVVVVLGCGYLDTTSLPGFSRPGAGQYNTLREYVAAAKQTEVAWLRRAATITVDSKNRFSYMMVVQNKLDLRFENCDDRGLENLDEDTQTAIDELAKQWCRTGITPTIHPLSVVYDSFEGVPPSGEFSARKSLLTLEFFRAQLRLRLLECRTWL